MQKSTKKLIYTAMIGALYAALTLILAPISYGEIQVRLAETLCILPFFMPGSVWGLFVGCAISNFASAYGLIDIVFGSLATLAAGLGVMSMGKISRRNPMTKIIAGLIPTITNGFVIGAIIAYSTAPDAFWECFLVMSLQIAAGEFLAMIPGIVGMFLLPKSTFFRELINRYDSSILQTM